MTPYAILKVKYTDSDKVIRKTYQKEAETLHPDANAGFVGDRWFLVTEAYNTIKTEELRTAWAKRLVLQAGLCSVCRGYGVMGSRVGSIGIKVCSKCGGEGRNV